MEIVSQERKSVYILSKEKAWPLHKSTLLLSPSNFLIFAALYAQQTYLWFPQLLKYSAAPLPMILFSIFRLISMHWHHTHFPISISKSAFWRKHLWFLQSIPHYRVLRPFSSTHILYINITLCVFLLTLILVCELPDGLIYLDSLMLSSHQTKNIETQNSVSELK